MKPQFKAYFGLPTRDYSGACRGGRGVDVGEHVEVVESHPKRTALGGGGPDAVAPQGGRIDAMTWWWGSDHNM